jgi:glutathione S-transferase
MSFPVILYGDKFWISPYVFSCFVALTEKNVDFEVRELSLGDGEQHGPEYAQKTVTARVPAIEHGGFALAESQAIVEYLEEVFPPPGHPSVLPANVGSRARCRQVLSWLRSDVVAPLRAERPTVSIFYGQPAKAPLTDKARASANRVIEVARRLLPSGASALFEAWSLADAELALTLQRLVCSGDAIPSELKQYADLQWRRPSVAAYAAHPRVPYVPYPYR